MPSNIKERDAALGLKYTVSALSHANLRACTPFIIRSYEFSPGGPVWRTLWYLYSRGYKSDVMSTHVNSVKRARNFKRYQRE